MLWRTSLEGVPPFAWEDKWRSEVQGACYPDKHHSTVHRRSLYSIKLIIILMEIEQLEQLCTWTQGHSRRVNAGSNVIHKSDIRPLYLNLFRFRADSCLPRSPIVFKSDSTSIPSQLKALNTHMSRCFHTLRFRETHRSPCYGSASALLGVY